MKKELKQITIIGNLVILIVVIGFWSFILYPDFNFSLIFNDSAPFTSGIFVLLGFNMFFIPFIEKIINKEPTLETLKEVGWFNIIFLFFSLIMVGLFIEGLPHIYLWQLDGSPIGYRSDKWDMGIIMGVIIFLVSGFRNQLNLSRRVNKLEQKYKNEVKGK